MAQGQPHRGGILGLARLIAKDGDALEYDLMRSCGATLDDVPQRISWRALSSFVRNADCETAIYRRTHPDSFGWTREAYILADIFDAIAQGSVGIVRSNHAKAKTPKPYARPKPAHKHGAVSVEEFNRGWQAALARHKEKYGTSEEVKSNG